LQSRWRGWYGITKARAKHEKSVAFSAHRQVCDETRAKLGWRHRQ
jgi:hypothetical protein